MCQVREKLGTDLLAFLYETIDKQNSLYKSALITILDPFFV